MDRGGMVNTVPTATGFSTVVVDRFAIGRPANARLIAAAPDLLEACKAALKTLDWMADLMPNNELATPQRAALRAAIAKAEGREVPHA